MKPENIESNSRTVISRHRFTAIYRGCNQIGIDQWANTIDTRVFEMSATLNDILQWLEKIGVREPNINMVDIAALFEPVDGVYDSESKWVSVDDRFPDGLHRVLVSDEPWRGMCNMHLVRWDCINSQFDTEMKVTHWQPLPTPPEVK